MELNETQVAALNDLLAGLDLADLVAVNNAICYTRGYSGDEIYNTQDFDDILSGCDPYDVACKVFYGDFNPMDPYFRFDGYANLQSIKYRSDIDIDTDDLISAYESDNSYFPEVIVDFFNDLEDEDEDEDEA